MNWTGDALITAAGLVLSILFGLIPPTKRWFENKIQDDWKPLFMVGVLAGIDVVHLLFSHLTAWPAWSLPIFDWTAVWFDIPQAGLVLLAAFGTNQGTYLATAKRIKDKADSEARILARAGVVRMR